MNATVTPIESAKPAEFKVTDPRGRVITLKKPPALSQYRIVETAGQSADIATYMRMVLPLIYVTAIDADPVFLPATKLQLEALITRLGDEGITAVMNTVEAEFSKKPAPVPAEAAAARSN